MRIILATLLILTCALAAQGSQIVVDSFDSYTNGSIVDQGGWFDRVNGSNYIVQDTVVHEGSKALQNLGEAWDSVVTKIGDSHTDGNQAIWIRTENRSDWGDYADGQNVQFRISKNGWDSPALVSLSLKKDGHAAYMEDQTDTWINFDTYADNTWTLAEIEWRLIDKSARFRVNSGLWTNWVAIRGAASFTDFDTVGIDSTSLGSGSVYFDTIGSSIPEPATLSLLASIFILFRKMSPDAQRVGTFLLLEILLHFTFNQINLTVREIMFAFILAHPSNTLLQFFLIHTSKVSFFI